MEYLKRNFTISKADYQALADLTKTKGETISFWVRQAIAQLLDKNKQGGTKNDK